MSNSEETERLKLKTLLVGINAKYIHTNLAIRNLAKYCGDKDIITYESTINDKTEDVLAEIISYKADVVGFSCYLWNIEQILYMAENIKKINLKTIIVLGGPEVSYDAENILKQNHAIDFIILGEGEERFKKLLGVIYSKEAINDIDGIAYRDNRNKVHVNMPTGYVNLDDIPLSYSETEDLSNKLVYYETSRGCPFGCAFCISSLDKGVRVADLNKVKKDFSFFANKGVRTVKLVDRSFNCDLKRAIKILDIIRSLNKDTVFHCEINPDLVDDEFLTSLKGLENKIQFEVGVQSTNPASLKAISRTTNVEKTLLGIKKLKAAGIKLHADLIAGLPYEDFESFKKSFDDLYRLKPTEIQLGFLKLLKGTKIRHEASKYGICFESKPPYEILYNNYISYDELRILKGIATLIEKYYNDGRFKHSLDFLEKHFARPFDLYLSFYNYFKSNGLFKYSLSLSSRYDVLYNYACTLEIDIELFRDFLNLDFLYFNRNGGKPACLRKITYKGFSDIAKAHLIDKNWIEHNLPQAAKLSYSQILKQIATGFFKHDILSSPEYEPREMGLVFFYDKDKTYFAKFNLE